jgi:hypothetical protein
MQISDNHIPNEFGFFFVDIGKRTEIRPTNG